MKGPLRPPLPSLAPIPAPLVRIEEDHRRLLRAAERLGLDITDPATWPEIAREVGWAWPHEDRR